MYCHWTGVVSNVTEQDSKRAAAAVVGTKEKKAVGFHRAVDFYCLLGRKNLVLTTSKRDTLAFDRGCNISVLAKPCLQGMALSSWSTQDRKKRTSVLMLRDVYVIHFQ